MKYLHVTGFLGLAVVFSLVVGAAFAERSFAQTNMVEISAADLMATAGDTPKPAQDKVNEKIAAATVTGGTVVKFPSGEFRDVGEIQVFGKSGDGPREGPPAVAARPITLRGEGTVFTGKIMINVQDSEYIVIEGFTFRDTQAPDAVTVASDKGTGITAGGEVSDATRVEDTGVVWLNTAAVGPSIFCGKGSLDTNNNITVRDNVFMNTARHGILARGKPAPDDLAPPGNYRQCEESWAMTVSGNRFAGIGLGPNAAYLDAGKTLPGYRNRESAVEGDWTYGWTVTGNVVGVTADGAEAAGTTANGIRLDQAYGKTVVRNNTVNNTAWSGIVVGGSSHTRARNAEIAIANNKVTNSRSDPYIVSRWMASEEGYLNDDWRFGSLAHPIISLIVSGFYEGTDSMLRGRVYKLPDGFTLPFLGEEDTPSRLVTSIISYNINGARPSDVGVSDVNDAADNKIPNEATVRYLRPGLEAGVELNRLTSGKVTVENNELTNNVVGLAVCPSGYCYADDPFTSIAPEAETLESSYSRDLQVPTVRNNRIYENRGVTDMPSLFAVADVVNGLSEDDVRGAGKNVLVLAGNYLGDYPRVRGAVNTDDLASRDADNVGLKEADPPGLDATGGAAFGGTAITLTYDEALDEESVPAAAAFTVVQADGDGLTAPIVVTGVSVSGTSVRLTLANAPGSGNSVTVSYDPAKAGSGTDTGPIRDVAGNEAPALASRTVTASTPNPGPPDQMPQPAATDGGGCALASGGGGGAEPGALLPLVLAMFVFGLGRNRNVKKNI